MDISVFGIDIGTTKLVIAQLHSRTFTFILNNENKNVTPTYSYYQNQDVEIYGRKAKEVSVRNYEHIFYDSKRLIGQCINSKLINTYRNYWSFSIDSKLDDKSGKVYYKNSDGELICPVKVIADWLNLIIQNKSEIQVRIVYPAAFTSIQKLALIKAAEKTNAKVDRLVPKAIAGLISYHDRMKSTKDTTSFIFTLGGGTLDTTIVQYLHSSETYKVLISNGDSELGGRDFDLVVVKIMEEKLSSQVDFNHFQGLKRKAKTRLKILQKASGIKEDLSETESETLPLSDIYHDAKDDEILRSEFHEKSKHLIQRIRKVCQLTVSEAKKAEIQIDEVLLFGMASSMAFVKEMMKEFFGSEVKIHKSTGMTLDFARGAALSPLFKVKNISYYPIGIQLPNEGPKIIFEKNLPLPKTISVDFEVVNQDRLVIPIYEVLSSRIQETTPFADLVMENIPEGKVTVIIDFLLDKSGMLHTTAKVKGKNELITQVKCRYQFD